MNEKLRMQYLEAMGVDYFVPRFVFANAPEPVECLLPAAEATLAANEDVSGALPVSPESEPVAVANINLVKQEPPVAELLEESVSKASEQELIKPEVVGSAVAALAALTTANTEVVKFSLSVWRAGESLLVIDEREVGAALPTEALLANIIRACGIEATLPTADMLSWPLVNLPGKPQGWPEARSMIATYLEGKLSHPVATILFFGEASYKAVLGKGDFDQCLWKEVSVDAFVCKGLVMPSLADILRNPLLKRSVWRCLLDQGVVTR